MTLGVKGVAFKVTYNDGGAGLKNPPISCPRPPTQNVAESVENYFRTFVHEIG